MSLPTPHINAKAGDFAKTVLMPGDPLRAKFIAENFLEHLKEVTSVRNMLGFTGTYHGKSVSVMGSGMGCSSIGIYSYELFNFYDVDQIIRVGSAGGLQPGQKIRDIVIGLAAATDSSYINVFDLPGNGAFCADFCLVEKAVQYARENNLRFQVGPILSSEIFYGDIESKRKWQKAGVLAVEMESAALYGNAMQAKKKALTICTISDMVFESAGTSSEERERSFTDMVKMSLSLI